MMIDIIIPGLLPNLLVKKRSKEFFYSERYIKRNNVFVDKQKHNTYHIAKNIIHISVASEELGNIQDVSECLYNILRDTMVGIKTNDSVYRSIKTTNKLLMLRM